MNAILKSLSITLSISTATHSSGNSKRKFSACRDLGNCSKILKHIKMTAPINPAMTQLSIKQARSTRLLLRQQNFREKVERHRRRPSRKCHPASPLRIHRSEEHTSELQSLMRNSYAVFCLKKKTHKNCSEYKRVQP